MRESPVTSKFYFYLAPVAVFISFYNDLFLALTELHYRVQALTPWGQKLTGGFGFFGKVVLFGLAAWVIHSPCPETWNNRTIAGRWLAPIILAFIIGLVECTMRFSAAESAIKLGQRGQATGAPFDEDMMVFGLSPPSIYSAMSAPFFGIVIGFICRHIVNRRQESGRFTLH